MWSEQAEREIRYFVLDDVESLVYVANMASIPLHVWSSRVARWSGPTGASSISTRRARRSRTS
jgi:DNA primase